MRIARYGVSTRRPKNKTNKILNGILKCKRPIMGKIAVVIISKMKSMINVLISGKMISFILVFIV
jgi:hypothetical protein